MGINTVLNIDKLRELTPKQADRWLSKISGLPSKLSEEEYAALCGDDAERAAEIISESARCRNCPARTAQMACNYRRKGSWCFSLIYRWLTSKWKSRETGENFSSI